MNPAKVVRDRVKVLTDLPNVGPAMASDLRQLGITTPGQLLGKDPLALYRALSRKSGVRQDPCVLDVFISLTRFANGEPPKPWWSYTNERKATYGEI
ncbi:MAG: helix-hairpin-helix domain-containing protein [Dokdonella sp.]